MAMDKIIKAVVTRLFVALVAFSVVGWIILFGKNLPSSSAPVVYAIVAVSIIASIYVLWKKPYLLHNKNVIIGVVIFILIGAVGWITSISEITDCKLYKCGEDFTCAKPMQLGMKITTGECTSEFSESANFTCAYENNACVKKPL